MEGAALCGPLGEITLSLFLNRLKDEVDKRGQKKSVSLFSHKLFLIQHSSPKIKAVFVINN